MSWARRLSTLFIITLLQFVRTASAFFRSCYNGSCIKRWWNCEFSSRALPDQSVFKGCASNNGNGIAKLPFERQLNEKRANVKSNTKFETKLLQIVGGDMSYSWITFFYVLKFNRIFVICQSIGLSNTVMELRWLFSTTILAVLAVSIRNDFRS